MVWVAGGTLAAILLGAITLLVVLLANGLAYFWPSRLEELQLADGRCVLGRRISSVSDAKHSTDFPFRTANKGFDPKTQAIQRIKDSDVVASTYPPEAVVVERLENSDFYGIFAEVKAPDLDVPAGDDSIGQLHAALRKIAARRAAELATAAAADLQHQRPARSGAERPTRADSREGEDRVGRDARSRETGRRLRGRSRSCRPRLPRWTWRAGSA